MPLTGGLSLSLHDSRARPCGAWKHRVASVRYLTTGASLVKPVFPLLCALLSSSGVTAQIGPRVHDSHSFASLSWAVR